MKKLLAAVAMAAVTCLAQAGVVFDNGAPDSDSTRCISGPNVCQGSGTWTVYDQFTLASATTVSGFANWNYQFGSGSYLATNWSVWSSTPSNSGTPLFAGSSLAAISNDQGYLKATVSDLMINLSAGSYWLGINHTVNNGAIWGYAASSKVDYDAIQLDGVSTTHLLQPRMAFTISAVPEPETYAMLLGGLGLLGAIARRRKQA